MFEIIEQAMWATATHCVKLIVPVVAITMAFRMFTTALYGKGDR